MSIGKVISSVLGTDGAVEALTRWIPDPQARREAIRELKLAALEHERDIIGSARDVIVAEAQSESWLTRSWRPIVMLMMAGAVFAPVVGLTPDYSTIPAQMWNLLTVGIAGYVGGRTAEKITKGIKINLTKDKSE